MPVIKIQNQSSRLAAYGIPWHAELHVLTLCERHLSAKTRDMLRHNIESLPDCGGNLLGFAYKTDKAQHPNFNSSYHIVRFNDGTEIASLPNDLRDCIIFAASLGFNAITFEPFDSQDCPEIKFLHVYPQ